VPVSTKDVFSPGLNLAELADDSVGTNNGTYFQKHVIYNTYIIHNIYSFLTNINTVDIGASSIIRNINEIRGGGVHCNPCDGYTRSIRNEYVVPKVRELWGPADGIVREHGILDCNYSS
jgi:hypothetical protein